MLAFALDKSSLCTVQWQDIGNEFFRASQADISAAVQMFNFLNLFIMNYLGKNEAKKTIILEVNADDLDILKGCAIAAFLRWQTMSENAADEAQKTWHELYRLSKKLEK